MPNCRFSSAYTMFSAPTRRIQIGKWCGYRSRLFPFFLGPRGPLVLPLVECTYVCKKNLDHNIYRHTCLMNHQKTRLTSLMAPWDPLDALLDPLAPPGPPMNPLGPLNRSLGLIQTQDHLVCITNHQRTHQMSLPILWNILPLPLDPL